MASPSSSWWSCAGIAIWKEAGEYQAQRQAAAAGGVECTDCNNFHIPGQEEQDHDHPHSHDLSWMFARMLIMFFPIGLFFLGLPNANSSWLAKDAALDAETLKEMAKDAEVIGTGNDNGVNFRILKTDTGLKLKETTLASGEVKLEVLPGDADDVEEYNQVNDCGLRPRGT